MPQYVYTEEPYLYSNGIGGYPTRGGRGRGYRGAFRGGFGQHTTIITVPRGRSRSRSSRGSNRSRTTSPDDMGYVSDRPRSRGRSQNRSNGLGETRPNGSSIQQGSKANGKVADKNGSKSSSAANATEQYSKSNNSRSKNVRQVEASIRNSGRDCKRLQVGLTDLTSGGPKSISGRIDFPTICQGIAEKRYTAEVGSARFTEDIETWIASLTNVSIEYFEIAYTTCGEAGGQHYILYSGRSSERPSLIGVAIDLGLATRAVTSAANGQSVRINDSSSVETKRLNIGSNGKPYSSNNIRRAVDVVDGKVFDKGKIWKFAAETNDAIIPCAWFYFQRIGFPNGTQPSVMEQYTLAEETYNNTKRNAGSSANTITPDHTERKAFEEVNNRIQKTSLVLRSVEILLAHDKSASNADPDAYVKI